MCIKMTGINDPENLEGRPNGESLKSRLSNEGVIYGVVGQIQYYNKNEDRNN